MSRVKPILAAFAIFAVLALIVRQVGRAVKHTFTPPAGLAQVDRSTPLTQNGLTLLEIDSVSPNRSYFYTDKGQQDMGGLSGAVPADTGLWIRLPEGHFLPSEYSVSEDNDSQNPFIVRARTNTGQTFPLHWSEIRGQGKAGLVLAFIPAGYPNSVQWMDVTCDDRIGDTATWRITHLPPMQHILKPPLTAQTKFQQGSIHMTAAVYRQVETSSGGKRNQLLVDVTGVVSKPAHQWELGSLRADREWEPPGGQVLQSGTFGSERTPQGAEFETSPQYLYDSHADADASPYLDDTHWVRLTAQLQEFDTYEERVTFQHVSYVKTKSGALFVSGAKPQPLTTPSGISVTLLDAQHRPAPRYPISVDEDHRLNAEIRGGQMQTLPSLPQSPFWRKYKQPVTISLAFPSPLNSFAANVEGDALIYTFYTPRLAPQKRNTFQVIVQQRVNLRTIPMTFMLPVQEKSPVMQP